MKLLVGSGNKKKLEEIRRRLAEIDVGEAVEVLRPDDLDPVPPVPEEPHRTFLENAVEKAVSYARATGLLVLADDSGLEVDALSGAPGVDSAYFAGRPTNDARNNARLLAELKDVPKERRGARYRCTLVLATPRGPIFTCDGVCEGSIGAAPRGEGGFGYDPLFLMPDGGRTFAELAPGEKDLLSHRGRALARFLAAFPGLISDLRRADRIP